MNGPSKHLSWKELACKDGTPYPRRFIEDGRVFELSRAFEEIRSLCGDKPIIIISGYRTFEWNRKIGGAPKSQHIEGRALDLKTPEGLTTRQFYDLIRLNAKDFGIYGVGLYRTSVHIDIRPASRLFTWSRITLKDPRA